MMISTANFEELEKSLQKQWTVDQFKAVLQQFTEQVGFFQNCIAFVVVVVVCYTK